MKPIGMGSTDRLLTREDMEVLCREAVEGWQLAGRRVLFVIPDLTRSCPMDVMFRLIYEALGDRLDRLDFMMALGTHPPMTEAQMYERVGITAADHAALYPKARFFNHHWDDPAHLTSIGTLGTDRLRELTDGRFELAIEVQVNKAVRDYDDLVIVGPVFPHEVAGFSGGNKYLFPGISGPDVLHFFHWLGAVVTNPCMIGVKETAVRRVIDAAAAMVPLRRHAFCLVVKDGGLAGLYAGTPEEAWSAAADLSREHHIVYKERPFHTVLSCAPAMYDELWVGAKCMYKLEPVVADGGTLIIYAPHIREVSEVHGALIRRIGYHTRDYFLERWEEFRDIPWGTLAHSTHVKGIGRMEDGVEIPRIQVVLATGIPESVCREINLGYLDAKDVNPVEYQDREEEGFLYVPKAGETLYRLTNPPPELGG